MNLVLFVSYQLSAVFFEAEFNVDGYIVTSQFSLYGAIYFLFRELLNVISVPSVKVLFAELSVWKLIDWSSIVCITCSYFIMDYQFNEEVTDSFEIDDNLRNLIGIATLMQALSLVSYLRLVNEPLAVFIVSLSKVRRVRDQIKSISSSLLTCSF